eukprot:3812635-Amphidinium_carterae.1
MAASSPPKKGRWGKTTLEFYPNTNVVLREELHVSSGHAWCSYWPASSLERDIVKPLIVFHSILLTAVDIA